jgi:hypothetical protein
MEESLILLLLLLRFDDNFLIAVLDCQVLEDLQILLQSLQNFKHLDRFQENVHLQQLVIRDLRCPENELQHPIPFEFRELYRLLLLILRLFVCFLISFIQELGELLPHLPQVALEIQFLVERDGIAFLLKDEREEDVRKQAQNLLVRLDRMVPKIQ